MLQLGGLARMLYLGGMARMLLLDKLATAVHLSIFLPLYCSLNTAVWVWQLLLSRRPCVVLAYTVKFRKSMTLLLSVAPNEQIAHILVFWSVPGSGRFSLIGSGRRFGCCTNADVVPSCM